VHRHLVRPDATVLAAQAVAAGRRLARGGAPRIAPGAPGVTGAVENAHIRMPVELHQPHAQGRRVPVEHHRRVRADPRARHQPLQRGGASGAVASILQVGVDVPQHGTVDVPAVVGGRADVDFDHAEIGVFEMPGQPARVDKHPIAETWPWPGYSFLCCRFHLNLPIYGCLREQFYDGAIAATLPQRWRNLGVRARPDPGPLQGR